MTQQRGLKTSVLLNLLQFVLRIDFFVVTIIFLFALVESRNAPESPSLFDVSRILSVYQKESHGWALNIIINVVLFLNKIKWYVVGIIVSHGCFSKLVTGLYEMANTKVDRCLQPP